MKKNISFLILLFVVACNNVPKKNSTEDLSDKTSNISETHTDALELNLKGKPKKVTEYTYEYVLDSKGFELPIDSENATITHLYEFRKDGNLSKKIINNYVTEYQYEDNMNTINLTYKAANPGIITYLTKKWNTDKKYTTYYYKALQDIENDDYFQSIVTWLDYDYTILKVTTKNMLKEHDIHHEFTKKGDTLIIKTANNNVASPTSEIKIVRMQLDKYGNPLKKLILDTQNDKTTAFIAIISYEYYH